jgi:hypothetical protein
MVLYNDITFILNRRYWRELVAWPRKKHEILGNGDLGNGNNGR